MELFNSLKKRLETYQEPFKHWAIDKPLTDFAIKEVCNAEIANPIIKGIKYDGTRAIDGGEGKFREGIKSGGKAKKYRCFVTKENSNNFPELSLFIKELSYITYFKYVPKDHHIRQIDVLDTIIDLLLFRDLELNNITIIFKNLLIDKPFSVIFFTYIIFFFCSAIYSDLKSIEKYTYFLIPIANLLLVLALYISVWKNMELQSPLRYIYAYLQFYLISIAYNFETFSWAFK